MADKPGFDADYAHKYFSANCFNMAWNLIEKPERSHDDDQQMIRLAQASIWHWTQRPDCTANNLSIGYWQLSRVYSLLDEPDNARKYAQLCLEITPTDDAFLLGYAYEALARAEAIAGNHDAAKDHLADAWSHAGGVTSDDDKTLLVDDLKTLE